MLKILFVVTVSAIGLLACQPKSSFVSLETEDSHSIINGSEITNRSTQAARSVVIIQLLDVNRKILSHCTGTLIGRNTILSAAHCFDHASIKNVAKFNVLFNNSFAYNETHSFEVREGIDFVKHPFYNTEKVPGHPNFIWHDHDLAVGIFKGPGPGNFTTVELDEDIHADYSHQKIYAYGYGRAVDYTGIASQDLNFSVGKLRRGIMIIDDNYNKYADRYYIREDSPTKVCQGDSGGPQFYHEKGVLKIIGVNSASVGRTLANGTSSCLDRSQATKVAPYAGWIRDEEDRLLKLYKGRF